MSKRCPFRVGEIVRIYTPDLECHGEVAKVDSVVKNILPVKAYDRKRSPKWTVHVLNPTWLCTVDYWTHQLKKATAKDRQQYRKQEQEQ